MNTRRIGKVALAVFGTILLLVSVGMAVLAIPGTPKSTRNLEFQGYIPLPKGARLRIFTAFDYVTIVDQSLFVTNVLSGEVYNVSLPADLAHDVPKVSVFPLEPQAHGVAIDPISHLGFVTRSEANTVDVFDPDKMRLIKRISVAEGADAIIYDPYHKLLYVTNREAKVATLIDPATLTNIAVVSLGGEPEFPVLDPQTHLVYQNLADNSSVAVVDVANRSVVQRWPLPGCDTPTGATIDASARRLFVVCGKSATFLALDLMTHQIVGSLPIGGLPDSVAYDPEFRRIYTTGLAGVMSVIQEEAPNTYRIIDTMRLHYGAHTLAIDPATHRIYAAYLSLFVPPRLAVFAPRR
jgi:YVTN family beta-propeller protein